MKGSDSGEYYESRQFNDFPEYKPFRAEEYYSFEIAKTPPETPNISEQFNTQSGTGTKRSKERDEKDKRDIRKELERARQSDSSFNSADTSSSYGSHAISSSQASSSAAATSAGSAVGGTVGAGAVAAFAVIIAVTIGLFINFGNYIKTFFGMDYMTLTVDIDEFISRELKNGDLCAEDFIIEYTTASGTNRIIMKSGKHTYLLTGLTPGENFTYKVLCTNPDYNDNSEYFSETAKVPEYSQPTGVFDEINNIISYNQTEHTVTLSYSVYLSDYNDEYPNATFYICTSELSDAGNITNEIFSQSRPDENRFFCGETGGIKCETVYLYIVGEDAEGNKVFLFSYAIDTQIPEDWKETEPPITEPSVFEIDIESESASCLPNEVSIDGKLLSIDTSYMFSAEVLEFDSNGNLIGEQTEAALTTDRETMTYSVNFGAYYGISSYRYIIYANDDDGNKTEVYESTDKPFTASQSFAASYNKVSPEDAEIIYDGTRVTLIVNPEFSSEYEYPFCYGLSVTNSTGRVFAEYCGNGEARLVIDDAYGLDEINFTYYDLAEFMGERVEYASYSENGPPFCIPKLTLSDELGFDGNYFTLSYALDMVYDYNDASIRLEIYVGDEAYPKNIDIVSQSGIIVFNEFSEAPGEVTVRAYLSFKDNSSDGAQHTANAVTANYDMSERFEVTGVIADISNYDSAMLVTVNFDYSFMPDSCCVVITDSGGYVDMSIPITDRVCIIDGIPIDAEDTLTVAVTNSDGVQRGAAHTYNISKAEAVNNYTNPTFNATNPGDALVTYNDDGTINIYRNVNFQSDDENVYYNAYIYAINDDGTVIQDNCYDIIGRDTYAVIENIPMNTYVLLYHFMFDFDGVSYIMYTETPSGSIYFPDSFGSLEVSRADGQTTVKVILSNYGHHSGTITIEGVDYQYDPDTLDSPYIVCTLDGEVDVSSVTVYFNSYTENYESISGDIEVNGNLYKAITLNITPEF